MCNNSIEESTQKLILSLLESQEYRHYQKLRTLIDGDWELRGKLNDFRRRVYEVQTSGDEKNAACSAEAQEQLGVYAARFRKNELIDEYLKAELHVCRMIQKVAFQLAEAIDLDLDEVVDP